MQHAKKVKEKERKEEEEVGVTLHGAGLPAWWHSAPDAESPRPTASFPPLEDAGRPPSAACCCSGWGRDRGMCGGTEDGGKGGTVTTRWLS